MPGIDEVLERVVSEPEFRERLAENPREALAGFDLSPADLEVLATELSSDVGGSGPVEARTTRAAMFGMLAAAVDVVTAQGSDAFVTPPMEALDHTGAYDDHDGDGLGTVAELLIGTDPENYDTDGDGLSDGVEFGFTDPMNPDTDGDGLSDGTEIGFGSDPNDPDTDNDGLPDKQEFDLGTDPNSSDSDGDGLKDGLEYVLGMDPADPDSDNDGLTDGEEIGQADSFHTDPNNPDTDGDGLKDGLEVELGTDPLDKDSDDDGLLDGEEAELGTDPLKIDTDGDGLSDAIEPHMGTDPTDADTDNDGLSDGEETAFDWGGDSDDTDTDPLKWDTDGDGWSDGYEVQKGTNPLDPSSHPTSLFDPNTIAEYHGTVPGAMEAVDSSSADDAMANPSGGDAAFDSAVAPAAPEVAAEAPEVSDAERAIDPKVAAEAPAVRGAEPSINPSPSAAAGMTTAEGPGVEADDDLGIEILDDPDAERSAP